MTSQSSDNDSYYVDCSSVDRDCIDKLKAPYRDWETNRNIKAISEQLEALKKDVITS